MANRKYMGKSQINTHEFIYVDLLPDVKRPRQFNANILFVVLFGVALSWFIVYMPLNGRQEELNRVSEIRHDLQHQRVLMAEEIAGYSIDEDRFEFYNQLRLIESLEGDYQMQYQPLKTRIEQQGGQVISLNYDHFSSAFRIQVSLANVFMFENLMFDLLELDFVESIRFDNPQPVSGSIRHRATYTIEVNRDAQ